MNYKLGVGVFLLALLAVSLLPLSSAADCDLSVTLINQDPYPAVPGEYVKIVFQVDGVDNPECGTVDFELLEEFPFSLDDPNQSKRSVVSSTFVSSEFSSFFLAPFRVRVDERALDGENEIQVRFESASEASEIEYFNITVENLIADFEVSIKDYAADTNTVTFEILNVGEADVEALTVEIPKQESIAVKGSNRNIVGNLDANEDTTFNFEATPREGEISLLVSYTDQINVRRQIEKAVIFDPVYFTDRQRDSNGVSLTTYIIAAVVVLVILFWVRRKLRARKKHKK